MPLECMGAHMTNRGLLNQYPNENDVRSLGLALIAGGFDYDEANHNGVGVEEVPPEVRASTKDPLTGNVYEGIGNYNERMTSSSDVLQTCFTKITARGVVVGTLSHTHLLLLLLCIAKGAKWATTDSEGQMTFPCNNDGYIDTAAVAAADAVLKVLLREGLDMEILSYKIYLEEPSACVLISNALNRGNKLALKTTELQALSTLTGEIGLSAVADKLNYDSIKESLRSTLAEMVDEPDFIHMFDFVARLGADKNSYIPEFLKWTSLTVSSKMRRLRLSTFAVLNSLKGAGPMANIALCKRCLRMKPTNTMCPSPEGSLEKRADWEFKLLDDILFFFHTTIKGAVEANVDEAKRVLFYGNVDIAAADAFVAAKQTDVIRRVRVYKQDMVAATVKYWGQVDNGRGEIQDRVGAGWVSFPDVIAELASEAAAESAVADLKPAMPTLVRYNESDGSCVGGGPELRLIVQASTERVKLPYHCWIGSDVTIETGTQAAAECAVKLVLHNLHRVECNRGEEDPLYSGINVLWDPKLKTTVVVTKRRLKAKELMLPPCIPDPKLWTESIHPGRVAIRVKFGSATATTFYIHPEWVHPQEKVIHSSVATPAVAGADIDWEHRVWQWSGKEVMHPMWATRRLTTDELRTKSKATSFNMMQHWRDVTTTVINGGSTTLWVVSVPMLTNTHDIEAGVELIWEALPTMKKQTVTNSANWVSDQVLKEKKRKEKKRKAVEIDSGVEI